MALLCQKLNCGKPATHAIQLGVPSIMDPEEAPPRARVLMGVIVCEECLDGETAEKWLEAAGDTLRPVVTISMGQATPPDFSRAVILGVPINSPEYQHLLLEGLNARKAN